jgi:hypothetical protein
MVNHKLPLNRETIRKLTMPQLSRAVGGVIEKTGTCYHCTDPWPPAPPFGGGK